MVFSAQRSARGAGSRTDLKQLADSGQLFSDTLVWTDGMSDWQPAGAKLASFFSASDKTKSAVSLSDDGQQGTKRRRRPMVFAIFTLVAVGILATTGAVLMPKLMKNKNEEVKKDDLPLDLTQQQSKPIVVDQEEKLMPTDIVSRFEGSVAVIKNRSGHGSGFLIERGIVVTNSHVIGDDTIDNIEVRFPSAKGMPSFKAELLFEDRKRDLAVLRIDSQLPPLRLCSSECVKGEPIVVIGSPANTENIPHEGLLGDPRYKKPTGEGADEQTYFLITAGVNPGNSGGPVFNMNGSVIGVVVERTFEKNGKQVMRRENINLAIPLADLRGAVQRAKGRNKQETDRAQALHDGLEIAVALTRATANYLSGLKVYNEYLIEADKNKSPVNDAIKEASSKIEAQIRQNDQVVLGRFRSSVPKTVSNAALGESARTRMNMLRDLYLASKSQFDNPTSLSVKEFADSANRLEVELKKLADGLDLEFGTEY